MRTIRVATRASALAMIQTRAVTAAIEGRGYAVEIVSVTTRGDRDTVQSLATIGGDGVFVKELESALLERRADVAVHSMKDLPTEMAADLRIGAVLPREDARDVLISRNNAFGDLIALPPGAVIGTSSIRRRAVVLLTRPDARPRELRGNVDTRVRKVLDGQYDAAILALAGMKRLGLLEAVGGGSPIPLDQMVPAVGQGAVCAQCRSDDTAIVEILAPLDDASSALETRLERTVLRAMGGGCLVPIGAHASVSDGSFALDAIIAAADGTSAVKRSVRGPCSDEVAATELAERMAHDMLDAGGRQLVEMFASAVARKT